uniref:Uncharacterized protein n=1 Tax=viral metagenome TaxID=1070528 RepID=A0A6M3LTZ3_9ZZZZ
MSGKSYPPIKEILYDFVRFIKEDNPKPYDWFEGNIHSYLDVVLEKYLSSQTKNKPVFTKITSNIWVLNLNNVIDSSPTTKPERDVVMSSQLGYKLKEKEDLHRIAVEVHRSKHGSFLKAFAAAYMRADQQNKARLRPTWLNLIEEYELDKEYLDKR